MPSRREYAFVVLVGVVLAGPPADLLRAQQTSPTPPAGAVSPLAALQKGAEAGDSEAQKALADCYFWGRETRPDYAKAFYWYSKAANKGLAPAQHALGVLYSTRLGIAVDYTTDTSPGQMLTTDEMAVAWFRRAADQGYVDSMFMLGVLLSGDWASTVAVGEVVGDQIIFLRPTWSWYQAQRPIDAVEAAKWYSLAAILAPVERRAALERARDDFQKHLTDDQFRRAQRLAQEWLAAYRKRTRAPG